MIRFRFKVQIQIEQIEFISRFPPSAVRNRVWRKRWRIGPKVSVVSARAGEGSGLHRPGRLGWSAPDALHSFKHIKLPIGRALAAGGKVGLACRGHGVRVLPAKRAWMLCRRKAHTIYTISRFLSKIWSPMSRGITGEQKIPLTPREG